LAQGQGAAGPFLGCKLVPLIHAKAGPLDLLSGTGTGSDVVHEAQAFPVAL